MSQWIEGTIFLKKLKKNSQTLHGCDLYRNRPIGRIGVWFCNHLNFLEGKVASERDTKENEQSLSLAQEKKQAFWREGQHL